jgi:hypothetical protein
MRTVRPALAFAGPAVACAPCSPNSDSAAVLAHISDSMYSSPAPATIVCA